MTTPPLHPSELDLVRSVLRQHPEVHSATLFGFRAKGSYHEGSDVVAAASLSLRCARAGADHPGAVAGAYPAGGGCD